MSISRNSLMELVYVGILGATVSIACMSSCSMQNARENAKPETIEARADAQLRIEESRRATIEKIEELMEDPQYLAVLDKRKEIGEEYLKARPHASPAATASYIYNIAGKAPAVPTIR